MKHVKIFQMKNATGKLEEIFLDGSARITCPPEMIPAPGQYLLAHAHGSDSPVPVPLFSSVVHPQNGFRSAPEIPSLWKPGDTLHLRGPIGRGFSIPASARKITLIAFDTLPFRLLGLIGHALKQFAEVTLVCDERMENLPEVVEIQPLKGFTDAYQWSDYTAIDINRENIFQLKEKLEGMEQVRSQREAQVLLRAPMPCGGIAECGTCALSLKNEWKQICKDGPVFHLKELM